MALLSFAGAPHGGRQRHLPEWQSQPKITPTTIIDHSIVGTGEQGYQHFLNRSVLESHFIVENDGVIWQLMDTDREADANLRANAFAVSIETGDRGDPDNQPWTLEQLQSLIWLHEAIIAAHPTIPRRRCPTSAGGGLGYHTLFGAPSDWTPVAKTCPGRVRKAQWLATLLPAFLNPPQEDDMPTEAEIKRAMVGALADQRDEYAKAIADEVATSLKPVLQKLSGSPHVFIRKPNDSTIYVLTPAGPIHVPNPSVFGILSGDEGITETTIEVAADDPIWG